MPEPTEPTCRYGGASHLTRPATALVWFNDSDPAKPLPVCGRCSKAIQSWMAGGRVNARGQYPTAHYPVTTATGRHYLALADAAGELAR